MDISRFSLSAFGSALKRPLSRPVEYLEFDEIQAVLTAIDRTSVDGRRDYALLATMFNTGARVQEIITVRAHELKPQDLHWRASAYTAPHAP